MKFLKLFENVSSHNQLTKLSSLIIGAIANRTMEYKKWDENKDMYVNDSALMMSCILPTVLSKIDVKGQGFDAHFRKFIKDKNTWFRISVYTQAYKRNTKASYSPDRYKTGKRNIEIELNYNKNDIEDYFKSLDEDLTNINFNNLHEFLVKRKNALLHELQHAYDDWNSDTKAFKKIINLPNNDNEKYRTEYDNYIKTSHEVSAFFTNTVDSVFNQKNIDNYYRVYNPTKWVDALASFVELYPRWEILDDKTKKRLTTRLYQIWDDKFGDRNKYTKRDITDKLEKLENKLQEEYGKSIYIHYAHYTSSISIHTIKVDSIEIEKDIYQRIIKLADTYRKSVTTNVYKGFTTSAIMKARVYLKEFGFFNNKTNKRDYRFRDDYVRYSKR